jgi:hypothetical protein
VAGDGLDGGLDAQPDLGARAARRIGEVGRQAREVAATGDEAGEQELPAGLAASLEQGHRVATEREHPRRLEAGRAAAMTTLRQAQGEPDDLTL